MDRTALLGSLAADGTSTPPSRLGGEPGGGRRMLPERGHVVHCPDYGPDGG
ncbi:hypothetical protein ACFV6F_35340 [Kitasatospora phosalacinea]|uniref:hypothetical protein n=1 Tax=Kitasatospora phosalacinea TaxID=2065 RepID=UPI003646E051